VSKVIPIRAFAELANGCGYASVRGTTEGFYFLSCEDAVTGESWEEVFTTAGAALARFALLVETDAQGGALFQRSAEGHEKAWAEFAKENLA
jgi:hypothetical protein